LKIQLFVPPKGYVAQRWDEGSSMPPLGILYVAAMLETHHYQVEVIPCDILGFTWNDVRECIANGNADIIGCTTTTENRFDSFTLINEAKKINPNIITVLGGPHISMAREDTVKHLNSLDYAVIGEGEFTLLELVQAIEHGHDPAQIKGMIIRKNNEAVFTGNRPFIKDLDVLPLPARHLIPMEKYNFSVISRDGKKRKAQNIMTSRGCPFNCYFCATPINWGRQMRGFSIDRVIAEIQLLIDEYQAEFIWFYDDTLNYNLQRLEQLMDKLIEKQWPIKFCNEFRIDLINKPLLEKMMIAGLDFGFFGIEAGNSRIRKEIVHKNFEIDLAYQFVRYALELGFTPNAFLIFSHFSETWQEALETIQIMENLKAINPQTEITTAILHIYPGTPIEIIAKANHIIPEDFSWTRKEDLKKVNVLPAAQGFVPLFKHKLTWLQIAELVMRWSATKKKILSGSKIKQILTQLTSFKDLYIYTLFFWVMIKYKIKKIIGSNKKTTAQALNHSDSKSADN
jgi:radical SAM superfamily enzyme YgiQ (UPF0313 family)